MSKKGYYLGGHSIFGPKRRRKQKLRPPPLIDRIAALRTREAIAAHDLEEMPRLIPAGDYTPRSESLKQKLQDLDKK